MLSHADSRSTRVWSYAEALACGPIQEALVCGSMQAAEALACGPMQAAEALACGLMQKHSRVVLDSRTIQIINISRLNRLESVQE